MRTIEFNDQPPNYVSIAHRTTSIESYCILRTRKMASWWKHLKLIFGMGSVSSYLCVNLMILYFKSNILYVFRFAVLTLIYAGSSIDDSPLINDAGDIRFHMNDSPVIWKRWLLLNAIHAEEINQIIFCLLRVLGVDDNSVYQAAPCWMNGNTCED